jgi:hypothetical protein
MFVVFLSTRDIVIRCNRYPSVILNVILVSIQQLELHQLHSEFLINVVIEKRLVGSSIKHFGDTVHKQPIDK